MSYLKVKEIFIDDTGKIEADKLNYSFNLLKFGGPIGPSGIQGFSGGLGLQGVQGLQGITGIQGLTGVAGNSNTHWDMDVATVPNSVNTGNILRPLYDSFSSRIILGDAPTEEYTTVGFDPSYEPQAFISFLTNNSGIAGEENAIELRKREYSNGVWDNSFPGYLIGVYQSFNTPTNLKIYSDNNSSGSFNIDMFLGLFTQTSLIDINAQQEILTNSVQKTTITSNDILSRSEEDTDIRANQISFETLDDLKDINVKLYPATNPLPSGSITLRTTLSDIVLSTPTGTKVQLQNFNGGSTNSQIEVYGRGANIDILLQDTSTIKSDLENTISSNIRATLGHGTMSFGIYNNTYKFNVESLQNNSSQNIFFSDDDGNHDGDQDYDALMDNNSMTTGDGKRWKEGLDTDNSVPSNPIFAAPNFGSTERSRTLTDYYEFNGDSNGGGLVKVLHNNANMTNYKCYGVNGDIDYLDAEYSDLPRVVVNENYMDYVSYTKIGDVVKVDGTVKYIVNHIGQNETTAWKTNSSTSEQLGIRIASPEVFPYVNASPFPIDVDVRLGKVGQKNQNDATDEIDKPLGAPDSYGMFTAAFDNINLKGVILPGDNKILLYGTFSSYLSFGLTVGITKAPIVPKAFSEFVALIWQIEIPTLLEVSYSFEMPTDWNSYNRLKTASTFSVPSTKSTDSQCSVTIPVTFSGPAGSNWSYYAVRLINGVESPSETVDTWIDVSTLTQTANSLQFQSRSVSGTNVRFYFTNSYTGEVKKCDLTISSFVCQGQGQGGSI